MRWDPNNQPFNIIRTCVFCGKGYYQYTEDQPQRLKYPSKDICPYCGQENGASIMFEYHNRKMLD